MTSISIDLSKKIELRWLSALTRRIESAAGSLPFFMVGAMARDLLLQHTYGIHTGRQTRDIDFAFHVETWAAFETVRSRLIGAGEFKEVRDMAHRLRFGELIVDLVPFGAIEKADRTIVWPPEGSTVMSVIGFREAFGSTVSILLPDKVGLRVPSLAGLALLKLMAWEQRRLTAPKKDAHDLSLILRNYLNAGNQERLYAEAHLLEQPDFDFEAAGAWLLGRDISSLLAQDAREHIARLLEKETDPNGALRMVGDLFDDRARALLLIDSLRSGFMGQPR